MELWSQSRIGPVNGSIVSRENVKQFAAGSTCSSYYMFVDVNERQPQPSAAPAGCSSRPSPSPAAPPVRPSLSCGKMNREKIGVSVFL